MKKRILIFDDDADILEVCSIVLETSGFEVFKQKDCDNILEKIDRYTPDVLLLDNKIPPFGGIQASQTVKASPEHSGVPIVFFSANQDVARLAKDAGADHFIEKPFDLDALVAVLHKAIMTGEASRV